MAYKLVEIKQQAEERLRRKNRDSGAVVYLLEWVTGKDFTQLMMALRQPLLPEQEMAFWQALERVEAGEPVQYIVGEVEFYGRSFKVNEAVLIPRPETEELVYYALQKSKELFGENSVRMADIGTGSGVIATTFSAERPFTQVTAVDISEAALLVAKENAERNKQAITFIKGDLAQPLLQKKWEIVLANPPYIARKEKEFMTKTVYEYEPQIALFAEEEGLICYRRLAEQLPGCMAARFLIGVEIGFNQGFAVHQLFEEAFPQATVKLQQDLHGNDRMVFIHCG